MNRSVAFEASRCLSSAWALAKQAPLPVWAAGLILIIADGCASGGGSEGASMSNGNDWAPFTPGSSSSFYIEELSMGTGLMVAGLMGLAFIAWIVFGALTALLRVGYYSGIKTLMREGTVEFGDMFGHHGRWLTTFLTVILQAVLWLGVGLLGIPLILIPGVVLGPIGLAAGVLVYVPFLIYVSFGLTFMRHAAAIEGCGPVEALGVSWNLADGERLSLFVMWLVNVIMLFVGLCACCIGVFPAAILVEVMWVEAYVQATGGPGQAQSSG